MAIVTLTPEEVDYEGLEGKTLTANYDAAEDATGFEFVNDGKTLIHIVNADSGTCVATVDNPQSCEFGGTTVHDVEISIPTADDYLIGPFPTHRFNASITGKVAVSLTADSDVTAISARAIKLV
jgi:hypothetical protein